MIDYEYKSIFCKEFMELVEIKKALGFKYESTQAAFHRLDKFFVEQFLSDKQLSKELCDAWCRKRSHETVKNQSHRISSLRIFSRYLVDMGMRAYIPPKCICGKKHRYDSHIYTDDELKRFFAVVDQSQSVQSSCPYRGEVMPVFFRILYTSGMRVSELRLLRVKDVDIANSCIIVHEAKNQKERMIPIHPKLAEKCRQLKEDIHTHSNEDEYFFMMYHGRPMPLANVYKNFRRYLDKAGIPHTGHGPRVHDFRHTYCVNLLRKWIEEGKDLMAFFPYMRTMLGHEGFEETAYYLKLTSQMYPYIRESLDKAFPNLVKEAAFEEHEFY